MALVKICHTQATHNHRSVEITDSAGKAERSTWKTAGTRVFFLAAVFLATAFLAGFAIFRVRVAMLHVYQTSVYRNRSLPYPNHMAIAAQRQPRRVQYRVGLGVTVSLLVAGAIALVAWASLANTRAAIVELSDQQVRELLTGLDTRVQDRFEDAVTAAQLSEKLMGNGVLRQDSDLLARHFTEVLRANPTFAWASYSDAMG